MSLNTFFRSAFVATLLWSCNDHSSSQASATAAQQESAPAETPAVPEQTASAKSPAGIYVGDFLAELSDQRKQPMAMNKITISIDSLVGSRLYGHSVVAGNSRPFSGNFRMEEESYQATCREPGDDAYDGVFTFTLTPASGILQGFWQANDSKLAVTRRSYSLGKTVFQYDPHKEIEVVASRLYADRDASEGELITEDAGRVNASTTLLTVADVENMYKRDLEVMRNAIYARHGYSFKNRDMRYFFDREVDWYIPFSTDVTQDLTELEKKNIRLIKRYEQHAESYYDAFGR